MNKYKLEDYIPEEEHNVLIDPNEMDDIPSVKIHIDDDNNMVLQVSSFYHSSGNGKIALLKNNQILQDLLMKAIQQQAQKMFRHTVHGILGQPYGLPENRKNKTMTNETKLWQLRAGLITEGEYMAAMEEMNGVENMGGLEAGTKDPNVKAISKVLEPRVANLKAIDTIQELEALFTAIMDKIQASNKEALNDNEVLMALRKVLANRSKK